MRRPRRTNLYHYNIMNENSLDIRPLNELVPILNELPEEDIVEKVETVIPVVESFAEPVVEPVVEPVEPVAEPVVEPVAEPVVEPVAEPVVEPSAEPVEPVVEPVAEPVAEPVVEPVEPVPECVPEPVTEPVEPVESVEPTYIKYSMPFEIPPVLPPLPVFQPFSRTVSFKEEVKTVLLPPPIRRQSNKMIFY